jgi:hypothetical protein
MSQKKQRKRNYYKRFPYRESKKKPGSFLRRNHKTMSESRHNVENYPTAPSTNIPGLKIKRKVVSVREMIWLQTG